MEPSDVDRITRSFFVGSADRERDLSGYGVLLILAALIASAGIVADSTATVIGAMIVAPLMRPILGIAAALVLVDRRMLTRSVMLVLGSVLLVIGTGVAIGLLTSQPVQAATNGQVAGRVSPRLIDLIAALATGLVGAFAAVRSDVSDTLPGVAIAISLVPPLAVVGLTLEAGEPGQALGALLLFGTNVTAIVATGVLLFLLGGLRQARLASGQPLGQLKGSTLAIVASTLALVAVPLAIGSAQVAREQRTLATAQPIVELWGRSHGYTPTDLSVRGGTLYVAALGTTTTPDISALRSALDQAGLGDIGVEVEYSLGARLTSPSP
jgi:uncharacterized hydrophobic protein (TIGR00271 family)